MVNNRLVLEWLDSVFETGMLALKNLRGNSWAPYSPDCNPCDFFLWGLLKERVYHPLPTNLAALKRKIKSEFERIPEVIVIKSIQNMKRRGVSWWNLKWASLKEKIFKHFS